MSIDTSIQRQDPNLIADGIARLLADTYTLYLKTRNHHWNATTPQFASLHPLFEAQYIELATAVDAIAERIRALGFRAPGSYAEFARLTAIKEAEGMLSMEEMIHDLMTDQETVARPCREILPTVEQGEDAVSADLVTSRLSIHEKTAWMLCSLVQR